ncbi:helix-turn-helix domain-containing protein [Flavobacterium sp.]|uniref:helix-turn-helix domain-containing protein n=1 Tax=Flavobacterium sp. TaxID=239 RepID=UPI003D6ADEE5
MTDDAYLNYRISVPAEFSDVFTHFYFAENTTDETLIKTLLPTFQTILVFCFGPEVTLSSKQNTAITLDKCLVLGPIKQAFNYTLKPDAQILVANFKDDAFYRFFGTATLEHIPFNPDDLLAENCFTYLWHQMEQLKTVEEKVNLILNFCKSYLKSQTGIATLLTNFNDETQNPIKAVSQMSQLSERAIQYQHKKLFGFTAKEKMRYQRFLKTIQYLQNNPKTVNWFDIVEEYGYYDQSQLIHDFKHYINLSPNQYLKFQQEICIGNSM